MGLRDLFFSITARDNTAGAFGDVDRRLKGISGAAATASERIDRIGDRLTRAGARGSIASAGIFAIFRGSIDLYDQQERAEAKVAQAIRATGGAAGFTADALESQASALQGLTRFGDEDILGNVTAQLLTFKQISGDTFTRAQVAALDLATTLDADLKSTAIQLGKALNDPVRGLTALSRSGVTFTDAQRDMVAAMVEAGDVAGAQKLILDEIASAYGGQAEAARQAGAGVRDAWRNAWGDVKEDVGGILLEGMRAFLPILQDIGAGFEALSPKGKRFAVTAGALAVAVPPLTLALGGLLAAVGVLATPVGAAVAGIAALTAGVVAFWPEIKTAATWIGETFAPALDIALDPLGALSEAVDGVGQVFARVFTAIPEIVGAAATAVADWIKNKFNSAMQSLGDKVEWVEGKFAWLYDKVVGNSWVPDLVDEVGQNFARLSGNMVAPTDSATGAVNQSFRGLMADVGSSLSSLATSGKLTWDGFMGSLHESGRQWADRIVSDVFDRMASGLGDALGGLGGAAGGGAGGGGGGAFGGLLSGLVGGVGGWIKGLAGFNTGGAFTVGGRAGIDRNLASVKLSQGERVHVERKGAPAQSGRPVNVYIQTPDPAAFQASRAQIAAQMSRALAQGARTT